MALKPSYKSYRILSLDIFENIRILIFKYADHINLFTFTNRKIRMTLRVFKADVSNLSI